MLTSRSAASRGGRHRHPTGTQPISAAAQTCAQDADAALTRGDGKQYSPEAAEARRLAHQKYFLL